MAFLGSFWLFWASFLAFLGSFWALFWAFLAFLADFAFLSDQTFLIFGGFLTVQIFIYSGLILGISELIFGLFGFVVISGGL